MSTEVIFLIVSVAVVGLLVVGSLLAVPRGQAADAGDAGDAALAANRASDTRRYGDAAGESVHELAGGLGGDYRRVVRILWWIVIAATLIGVGLSGSFSENEQLIFGLGAVAVGAALLFHDVAPASRRTSLGGLAEAFVALALATGLLVLTGFGSSPYILAYDVAVVAVALARGGRGAFIFAAVTSLAYVGVLAIDPARTTYQAGDLLRFGLHIGALWLLTLLASVFAAQQRRIRASMLQMSITDPLTGLFNRSQIHLAVDNEIRRTRRSDRGFCLLMIDLDGLKLVNDSLGHHRGDEVLAALGGVILRSIRTVDSAYRYGGDEFLILLPETDIVGAFVVAEKIRAQADEIAVGAGGEGRTSVSIGLVSHPEDGATVEELMIAADRAMYTAKGLGKNQISGFPRPRRGLPAVSLPRTTAPAIPVGEPPAVEDARSQPSGPTVPAPPSDAAAGEVRTTSVHTPPATVMAPAQATEHAASPKAAPAPVPPPPTHAATANGSPVAEATGDDELDPAEARRRIAALSYDSDHQIRRAMDAFLGAPRRDRRDDDRRAN